MNIVYPIEIAEHNSAGIRAEARLLGITHMRLVAEGYPDGYEDRADYKIRVFALPNHGYEFRVADTNGAPVWEEADPQAFADLLESCGIEA